MKRKLLSLFLCAALLCGAVVLTAGAAEIEGAVLVRIRGEAAEATYTAADFDAEKVGEVLVKHKDCEGEPDEWIQVLLLTLTPAGAEDDEALCETLAALPFVDKASQTLPASSGEALYQETFGSSPLLRYNSDRAILLQPCTVAALIESLPAGERLQVLSAEDSAKYRRSFSVRGAVPSDGGVPVSTGMCLYDDSDISIVGCRLVLLGDLDGDGKRTAEDARLTLRLAVGLEQPGGASLMPFAADADGDGIITAADARLVLRASVGLETADTLSARRENGEELAFDARYLRLYIADIGPDKATPIASRAALKAYFEDNAPQFGTDNNGAVETDILAPYTDEFFEDKALVLVSMTLSSGSHRLEATALYQNGVVAVNRIYAAIGTTDIANRFIFLTVDKDKLPAACRLQVNDIYFPYVY